MDTLTFRIHTVDPDTIQHVRRTGRDVNGNPVERIVAAGGEPLRCCLTDARPGDDLLHARRIGAVLAAADA